MGIVNDLFKNNDLSLKIKKGEITYGEILNELSLYVARFCNGFYELDTLALKEIEKYNSDKLHNEAAKCIEELESNVSRDNNLNRLTLEQYKDLISKAIWALQQRKYLLDDAALCIQQLRDVLAPTAGVEFDDKDFIKRCTRAEAVEYAKEHCFSELEDDSIYVDEKSLTAFMEWINTYSHSIVNEKITCFNNNGQFIDNDGNVIEPAGDIIANVRYIDFKGY